MAKELHIKIDDVIGWDIWAFWPGFMAFMLDGYLEAAPETEHLVIHLDSPGGDVIEGYRIYNRLEQFKEQGGTVEVIVEGMAASMATAIAQAASPGMRKARAASTWLMHKPLFQMGGNAEDLRKMADQLDGFEDTLVAIYAKGSGNSPEVVRQHLDDAFINPQEAVSRGYLDAVVDADPAMKPKEREAKAVAFYNPNSNKVLNLQPMANTTAKAEEVSILAKIKDLLGIKAEAEPGTGGAPTTEAAQATETTVTAEETAPTALSAETTEGVKLEIDGELAEGSAVYTVTEEGTRGEALADGTYTLTSGEEITVADGVITSVVAAAEVAAQARVREAQAVAQAAKLEQQVQALQAKVTKLEKAPPAASGKVGAGTPQMQPSVSSKGNTGHPLDGDAARAKTKRF